MITYPEIDVSTDRALSEMVGHIVGLRRVQSVWLEKQRACSPVSEQWFEFEQRFNDACDMEIDWQLRLTAAMLRQGVEYVEDTTGTACAALACIAAHTGSLYAHVSELPVTAPVQGALDLAPRDDAAPGHSAGYEALIRAAHAVLDDREINRTAVVSDRSRHSLDGLSDAVRRAEAVSGLVEVRDERCA